MCLACGEPLHLESPRHGTKKVTSGPTVNGTNGLCLLRSMHTGNFFPSSPVCLDSAGVGHTQQGTRNTLYPLCVWQPTPVTQHWTAEAGGFEALCLPKPGLGSLKTTQDSKEEGPGKMFSNSW